MVPLPKIVHNADETGFVSHPQIILLTLERDYVDCRRSYYQTEGTDYTQYLISVIPKPSHSMFRNKAIFYNCDSYVYSVPDTAPAFTL